MATIRAYTTIEQSKKLAEILPIESADGFWEYHDKWCSEGDEWEGYEDYSRAEPYLEYTRKENEWKEDKSDVPCWSLTALLNVLPNPKIYSAIGNSWVCECWKNPKDVKGDESTYIGYTKANNQIDACYKMIIHLNEQNLL